MNTPEIQEHQDDVEGVDSSDALNEVLDEVFGEQD